MISVEALRGYLDSADLVYSCDEAKGVLVLPFSGAQVSVRLLEEGEAVVIYVPSLLAFDEAVRHRGALLRVMAQLNYRLKIGSFGLDPKDGEISVAHFVPVEDGDLTAAQFLRAVHSIASAAARCGRLLRRVAHRGDGGLSLDELLRRVEKSLPHRRLPSHPEPDPRLSEPPEALRKLFEELAREADQTPPDATDAPSKPEGDDHE